MEVDSAIQHPEYHPEPVYSLQVQSVNLAGSFSSAPVLQGFSGDMCEVYRYTQFLLH